MTILQSKLDRIQSNSKTLKGEADLIEKQVTSSMRYVAWIEVIYKVASGASSPSHPNAARSVQRNFQQSRAGLRRDHKEHQQQHCASQSNAAALCLRRLPQGQPPSPPLLASGPPLTPLTPHSPSLLQDGSARAGKVTSKRAEVDEMLRQVNQQNKRTIATFTHTANVDDE